jgi:hypothetical protein
MHGFPAEVYHTFEEKVTLMLLKLFQKIQREEMLPSSFYEARITLIPKQERNDRELSLNNFFWQC